jgi:type 1 glutamine amidotransferase
MKRRDFLLAGGAGAAGLALWPFPLGWTAEPKGAAKQILFFSKSSQYEHDVVKRKDGKPSHSERVLTDLGKEHGFEVTATKDGGVFDSDLERYDAIFFFTQGDMTPGVDGNPPVTASGKKALLEVIERGTGFLGTHCASDTFHSSGNRAANQALEERDPYIRMIGGEFVTHGAQQESRLGMADAHFPGTTGLGDGFRITDEWYALKNFAPDLHVILYQDTQGMTGDMYHRPPFPETWARRHGKGRVFFTSMGHRADVWANRTFQQILLGGLAWSVGNVEAEVPPNMKSATPHADALPG